MYVIKLTNDFITLNYFSNFQFICSWLLRPFAFIMGVDWEDCGPVGELLGIKTFANEFIAYADLSTYIDNAKENNGGTTISVRLENLISIKTNPSILFVPQINQ